jgi:hypothetical protein
MSDEQPLLFDIPKDWEHIWKGMPGYEHRDLTPKQSILVHFKDEVSRVKFSELVKQRITPETRYIWYPEIEIGRFFDKLYETPKKTNPRYPVYVISKGRWDTRMTVKSLERIGVPYHVVIEPQEYAQYAAVIDPVKIMTLPFSNLGQGSIPARNWVWEHSIDIGAKRHWILDDNIRGFHRFNNNLKAPVSDGTIFRVAEDFTDRYENVALSGFQYWMFVPRKNPNIPPFYLNTRIYSCILINNAIPYRWRGRYNEDTDLSIRTLTDGWCTVLFNAFIADKMTTMTMKGGNTDELYKDDGRLKMAESLKAQHPNLVTVTRKWGRWQHHVNYSVFKRNKLRLKRGVIVSDERNDYGMDLRVLTEQAEKPVNEEVADGERQEAADAEGLCEVARDGDNRAEGGVAGEAQAVAQDEDRSAESRVEDEAQRGAPKADLFDPYIVAPDDP